MSPIMILRIIFIFRVISFILIDTILIGVFSIIGALFKAFGPFTYINDLNTPLVILIHGSGTGHWQWLVAKFYLYICGINFVSVKYNYLQAINLSCASVLEQLAPYTNTKLNRKLILIGHSQGGLIARAISEHIHPTMLFLMHSPQKGASLINWMYQECETTDSNNDMRQGSKFIRNLHFPLLKHVYEIVGINDFVRYYECIAYKQNVYKSWFGHYFSAVNPYLWLTHIIPCIKQNTR